MFGKLITAALAGAVLATSVQAQEQALNDNQIEFFAETLAMGDVCGHMSDFHVVRDELQGWVNARLAGESPGDVSSVLERRDSKLADMESSAASVRDMDRGSGRQRAIDGHYASLTSRCNRMSDHSLVGRYFRANARRAFRQR